MEIKVVFLFFLIGLFFIFPLVVPINAQQPNQVPSPPSIPQPEPEPEPIHPKKTKKLLLFPFVFCT